MRIAFAFAVPALLTLTVALTAPPASVATPRVSLTDVENDVMCVSCREPLAVAQSPQALFERNYIRRLIAEGLTKPQIEAALVAQYGPAVLGRPPASGFNLTVYVLPPTLLVLGAVILALTLPRWRRRTRLAAANAPALPTLGPAEAQRLDRELATLDP